MFVGVGGDDVVAATRSATAAFIADYAAAAIAWGTTAVIAVAHFTVAIIDLVEDVGNTIYHFWC